MNSTNRRKTFGRPAGQGRLPPMRPPLALALAGLWLAAACAGTPAGPPPAATGEPDAPTAAPTATAGPAPTATLAPTSAPQELRLCMSAEPDSLYPYRGYAGRAKHLAAEHVRQALFDGPIDPVGFEYRPVLVTELPTLENGGARLETVTVATGERYYDQATGRVTEWREAETSMERLVMTYTLRPGVLWADGEPLTADDSAFAFEVLAGSGADPAMEPAELWELAQRTDTYEALDEQTVRWTGLPGYVARRPLITFDTFISPMPRHQLGETDPSQMANLPEAARQPLGWGPFVMQDWQAGEAITLKRNPLYFRAAEGLPRLDTLVFRFVPDPVEALRAVAAGECDAVLHDTFGLRQAGLLPLVDAAAAEGTLAAQFQAEAAWEHLDFNLAPLGDRPALFADSATRQAVAYCLDRQALADAIYPGHGAAATSLVPPANPNYLPETAGLYAFDPAAGRAALSEAGWAAGGSGLVEKDGVPLAAELILPEGEAGQTLAALVAQQLADCGIGVTPRFVTADELSGVGAISPIYRREFDLALFAWRGGLGGEPQCQLYLSADTPTEETGWQGSNVAGYNNPAYDAACREALRANPAEVSRAAHLEAQRLLAADLPSLPLFHRLHWLVARPAVRGLGLEGIAADELRSELIGIEEVDLNG